MSQFVKEKTDQRKTMFKKALDADDARRKREELTIQLRKSKKDERLNKRRNLAPPRADAAAFEPSVQEKVCCTGCRRLRSARGAHGAHAAACGAAPNRERH